MHTSAIHQRVADFLKEYPPFWYFEAEALERLAADGRVLFREQGDLIFEEGKPRARFVYVIEQGGVRLSFREDGVETLADLRGAGEMLGVGEPPGSLVYRRSAHAIEDTILYALDAAVFHRESAASPRALRFLSLLSSAGPGETDGAADGRPVNWFQEPCPPVDRSGGRLLSCPPETPVREVARRMAVVEDGAMVVVDEAGCPLGICTNFDLRTRVATGDVPVDAAVREVMRSPVFTIPPGLSVGNSLLEMMRRGARHLCVTEDGTVASRALETLSEHALMVLYGNNPLTVLRAINSAPDVPALAALRDRVDGLLRRGLQRPADVDWYCEVISEIDRALIRRLAELIRENHGGAVAAGVSLLLLGTAGRREKLARTEIGLAAILPDGAESGLADVRVFLAEITAALERCGFARRTAPNGRSPEFPVYSLAAWEQLFRDVITRPVEGDIHSRLALFDFDPLEPGCPLAGRLREVVREAVEGSPKFREILADDAVAHVPPLTFFEGQAVDEKGEPIGVFDINDRAFWAVSDVARALAFECGELEARSTLARLQRGGEEFPAHSAVLKEAARAVRIILYLRARNAFLTGGEGNVFTPDSISLADQAMLKFSFRAITKLLDFVRTHYGLA